MHSNFHFQFYINKVLQSKPVLVSIASYVAAIGSRLFSPTCLQCYVTGCRHTHKMECTVNGLPLKPSPYWEVTVNTNVSTKKTLLFKVIDFGMLISRTY